MKDQRRTLTIWGLFLGIPAALALVFTGCFTQPPDLNNPSDQDKAGIASDPPPRTTPPAPPTSRTPAPTPRSTPPQDTSRCKNLRADVWWQFTKQQKRDWMECNVLPQMLALFSRHDTKYAAPGAFHCQTCHGEPITPGSFDFSKPSHLIPLDPGNMPTEFDKDPKLAATVKFMKEEIVPAMQRLVPSTTITCFSCHAEKK